MSFNHRLFPDFNCPKYSYWFGWSAELISMPTNHKSDIICDDEFTLYVRAWGRCSC